MRKSDDVRWALGRGGARRRLVCALCVMLGCMAGCPGENGGSGAPAPASDAGVVEHRYTLRGRIVSLPDPSDPVSELIIHHEAIGDFKMGDGEPAPMKAMKMPFTPGPDVMLDDLAVGDVIAFEFHMRWSPSRSMTATAIKKLPADTKLGFESAGEAQRNGE